MILTLVTGVFGGVGWWFRARREDKLRDLRKIEDLQKEIYQMQQDRILEEIKRRELLEAANKAALENASTQAELIALLKKLQDKGGV